MQNITKEDILKELENVIDPELHIDIVNLGLVYDITFIQPNDIKITMTMTSMGCPLAGQIIADVKTTLIFAFRSLENIEVELVWSPLWTKERMSRMAKLALGVHIS